MGLTETQQTAQLEVMSADFFTEFLKVKKLTLDFRQVILIFMPEKNYQ